MLAAARNIGRLMTDCKAVIDKSTVPVGTGDKVQAAIVTEWEEFSTPDFQAIKAALRTPVVLDGRCLSEPAVMVALGVSQGNAGPPQVSLTPSRGGRRMSSAGGRSIVVTQLRQQQCVTVDLVDHAVFFGDSARPISR